MAATTNTNFGRVIYLTICRTDFDPNYTYKGYDNAVTIVFDPKKIQNGNTRIDFWVKHSGAGAATNSNAAYSIANIDIYNIGPALQQFMDAYNSYTNSGQHWVETNVKRWACSLKVGHGDNLKTIFTGYIGSYNVERVQTDSTVDTIWHLYAQYPTTDVVVGEENKAVSGTDYTELATQWIQQTFVKGEDLLKAAVMARPRDVFAYVAIPNVPAEDSFSALTQYSKIPTQTKLAALPGLREINNENFDLFFKIKYQHFRTGQEYPEVKKMWQAQSPMSSWNMDYSNLQSALSEIAEKKNCYAYLELNEETGMQTIYIYPAGQKTYATHKADYIIEDFQNLRRQPGVAANLLQLDMLMEPGVKPGDTFELRVSDTFIKKQKFDEYGVPSFGVNFSGTMPNATTAFAGANFIGMHNMLNVQEKQNAVARTGNIFGNQYVSVFVVHQGSTHTSEWSTQVDCAGVVVGGELNTFGG